MRDDLVLAVLIGATVIALTGCGGSTTGCDGPPVVRYHGQNYVGGSSRGDLAQVRALGTGEWVSCDGSSDGSVKLFELRGVPSDLAVGVQGASVMVAAGYVTGVRSSPLFRERDQPHWRRCGKTRTVQGSIISVPPSLIGVRKRDGTELYGQVIPSARIRGLERGGMPYIAPTDRVVITGQRCVVDEQFTIRITSLQRAEG